MIHFDKNLSEFIGIMLGDGYFTHERLKISLNSITDKDYRFYISKLVHSLFGVWPILKFRTTESTANLFLFKRKILKFLAQKGLRYSPKWNRATIPPSFLKYDLLVLRGYFDTDGSVVITNNNGTIYPRLEMKICPSPMQKQFINILEKYKFHFGVYDIGKGKVRIQMNGKKPLVKWMNLVGSNNQKHLQKIKRFVEIR